MKRKYFIGIALFVFCFGIIDIANAQYNKMLIVGNSLTHHSPSGGADGLTWDGDWGMAASCEANDFAHRLQSKIQADQPEAPLELQVAHITDERNTMTGYDHLLDNNADLIIIELGDNYRGEESYQALQLPLEKMIQDLAAGGNNPEVIVLSPWGYKELRSHYIQQAAISQNTGYVDISVLANNPLNMASSEDYCKPEWLTNGVGWHPGDRGMEAIASAIYAKIPPHAPEPASFCLMGIGITLVLRKRPKV